MVCRQTALLPFFYSVSLFQKPTVIQTTPVSNELTSGSSAQIKRSVANCYGGTFFQKQVYFVQQAALS